MNAWTRGGSFSIYPPDFWISLFNQFIFLIMVVMVFFLARQLFDSTVAWTSSAVFLGTDLLWRFSISGLSTMLAMLIFLALAWCLKNPHVSTVITGASRPSQVTENMGALAVVPQLTPEVMARIDGLVSSVGD